MAVATKTRTYRLHVISDSTGNLADHMLNTALGQFDGLEIVKKHHIFQNDPRKLNTLLSRVSKRNSIVCHALADEENKRVVEEACARRGIPCIDLTGPLVNFFSGCFEQDPVNDCSRIHCVDERYSARIDAMEFTLQHDDSRRLETAHEADLVILGISRVSKSPTSLFLGSMGYKVANVSVALSTGFPAVLDKCRKKTVALTMQPKRLHEIRQRRFDHNGFANKFAADNIAIHEMPYLNLKDVIEEVMLTDAEYRRRGYPIVDVTHTTIEETAALILNDLGIKR